MLQLLTLIMQATPREAVTSVLHSDHKGYPVAAILLQGGELEAAEELLRGYSQQQAVPPVGVLQQYASAAAAAAGWDSAPSNQQSAASAAAGRVLEVLPDLPLKQIVAALDAAAAAAAGRVLEVLPDLPLKQIVAAIDAAAAAAGDMPAAAVLNQLVDITLSTAAGSSSQALAGMSAKELQSLMTYRCRPGATAADVASAQQLLKGWEAANRQQAPDVALATYIAAAAAAAAAPEAAEVQDTYQKWLKAASAGRLLGLLKWLLQQQALAGVAAVLQELASRQGSTEEAVQQQLQEVLLEIEEVVNSSTSSTTTAAAGKALSSCLLLGLEPTVAVIVSHMNQVVSQCSHAAMPANAAAALGFPLLPPAGAAAAAAESAAVTHHLSCLVTHLLDQDPEWSTGWEQQLQPPAAAAALFSCWAWCSLAPPQLLQLYNGMRQLPGSKELLLTQRVCEVALAAAGQARDWDAGGYRGHS
jgi:hypothetical protein